jgi:hypothetical protein
VVPQHVVPDGQTTPLSQQVSLEAMHLPLQHLVPDAQYPVPQHVPPEGAHPPLQHVSPDWQQSTPLQQVVLDEQAPSVPQQVLPGG